MSRNVGASFVPPQRLRVAVFATHPIQYQVPLWRRLATDSRLDLRVFYGSDLSVRGYHDKEFGVRVQWDTPLTTGYSHEFLERDPQLQRLSFFHPRGQCVGAALDSFRPDVILLNAYNGVFWLRALLAARVRGVPVVMRHEASDEAQDRGPIKAVLRDIALRILYAQVARFAAIGTNARRHLLRLGVHNSRIGPAPYCVDTDDFERQHAYWSPRRKELRYKLGVGEADIVFIFSGKLIPKKQPLLLVAAMGQIPPQILRKIHLIVMGDGEQRGEMEKYGRIVLGNRLHMVGFVNQSQAGRWYAASDCLILPSARGAGETWGLVVNEALQFGIPAIVTRGVGCHHDLINDQTGLVVGADEATSLAEAIMAVAERRKLFDSVGIRSHAAKFSMSVASLGLSELLCSASKKGNNV